MYPAPFWITNTEQSIEHLPFSEIKQTLKNYLQDFSGLVVSIIILLLCTVPRNIFRRLTEKFGYNPIALKSNSANTTITEVNNLPKRFGYNYRTQVEYLKTHEVGMNMVSLVLYWIFVMTAKFRSKDFCLFEVTAR